MTGGNGAVVADRHEVLRRLSDREREVLHLLACGMSVPEIALRLGRSPKTIESHRLNLGRKLNVRNRVELTLVAIRIGLGPEHGEARRIDLAAPVQPSPAIHPALQVLIHLEATISNAGEDVFRAIAREICRALNVRCVIVGHLGSETSDAMEALGACLDGSPLGRFWCSMRGDWNGEAHRLTLPYPLAGIHFSEAHRAALCDRGGRRIGCILALHDHPLDTDRQPDLVLSLVAGRASAELLHWRAVSSWRAFDEQCRLFIHHGTDMVARQTLDGTYLFVSSSCRALLGYAPGELVGRSSYGLIHPDDLGEVQRVHASILGSPETYIVRLRMKTKGGAWRWVEHVSRTVRDATDADSPYIVCLAREGLAPVHAESLTQPDS